MAQPSWSYIVHRISDYPYLIIRLVIYRIIECIERVAVVLVVGRIEMLAVVVVLTR